MFTVKKIWNTNGGAEIWAKHPDLERAKEIAREMSIEESSTSKEIRVVDQSRRVVAIFRDGIEVKPGNKP